MEALTKAVTAEEQDALQKLPSASPDWQREMAIKLAEASRKAAASPVGAGAAALSDGRDKSPRPTKRKVGFAWWPKLGWAGAGLAIGAAAGWVGSRLTREPDGNQALPQA